MEKRHQLAENEVPEAIEGLHLSARDYLIMALAMRLTRTYIHDHLTPDPPPPKPFPPPNPPPLPLYDLDE